MTGGLGGGTQGLGGFLGFMFENAGRLGSRAEQGREQMRRALSAAQAQGQQISGNEILSRQQAIAQQEAQWNNHNGMFHIHQAPAGEALIGRGTTGLLIQPNMFTRWLDIRDSEDELQEFLTKCVHYGARYRTIAPMSVEKLESDNE